jgi:type IV pilus assembly protein PilM
MAQRVVAVEISPRVARVVVLETTLRRTDVAAVSSVPLPEGATREQVLAAVRGAVPEAIDTLVFAADSRVVSTRRLHFPFGDLRRLDAAVLFELENQVPYDIEDTALSYSVVSRTPTSMDVLTAVMPKKPLRELITEAEAAGVEPRVVVPAAAALVELAPHGDPDPIAIVSLGETISHLAVVRGGTLLLSRTLRAGGADVDRALAKAFGVELPAAKEAKEKEVRLLSAQEHEAASADLRRVADAAAAGLTPLVTGLATTFKALPVDEAPVRLLVTGGLSRLPGLCEHLGERLGIEMKLVDLQSAVAAAGEAAGIALIDRLLKRGKAVVPAAVGAAPAPEAPAVAPEYALGVALAIAVARHGRSTPLNLRRGDLAYQGDLQIYRGQITRIAVGVASVILLAIAGSVVRYTMLGAEERRLDAGFCAATKKIVGREICDPTAALATLKQPPGAGEGVVIPPYSAGALLEMMSRGIGPEIDVSFEDLELRVDGRTGEPDRITGKGEAASFESTEQISQSLKRDPCVQDVEVGKQRKTRDGGRVEFNLNIKVSCPPGTVPGKLSTAQAGGIPRPAQPGGVQQ